MTTTADSAALENALRHQLPHAQVSAAAPALGVDGLQPALALTATSPADVAAALAIAMEQGAAVVPWGGGSQMAYGMPPQRYDLALDLRGLASIIEYEPADLTVTVEAGMPLAELQRLLAQNGQWLPLDPPLPVSATIGGIIATNASGPARHARGTLRDLLIGIRVATPHGELVKSGGRVVKNVAGYDMGKLHIGALGTLGVVVQAGFKVAPLPERVVTMAATGEMESLARLALDVEEARLATQSLILSRNGASGGWSLLVRFAGGLAAVERSQQAFTALAAAAHAPSPGDPDAAWTAAMASLQSPVLARCSVPPSATLTIARAIATNESAVVAYPSTGTLYACLQETGPEFVTSLRRRCVEANGALVLERAPLDLKRAVNAWGEPRGDFRLMQRLKQEMDPQGVLNPGRFLGGI